MVIAIAQGSRTFASKSSFAQVKYLRKKARKHMQFVSALRPTALALSDMYAAKAPEKLLVANRPIPSCSLQLTTDYLHYLLLMKDLEATTLYKTTDY